MGRRLQWFQLIQAIRNYDVPACIPFSRESNQSPPLPKLKVKLALCRKVPSHEEALGGVPVNIQYFYLTVALDGDEFSSLLSCRFTPEEYLINAKRHTVTSKEFNEDNLTA
jgi:hypothetical protein